MNITTNTFVPKYCKKKKGRQKKLVNFQGLLYKRCMRKRENDERSLGLVY